LLLDDTAVIGTPGPYTWRGTVFVISVSDNFLDRDKTFYHGPLVEHESPVDKYSYLGKNEVDNPVICKEEKLPPLLCSQDNQNSVDFLMD